MLMKMKLWWPCDYGFMFMMYIYVFLPWCLKCDWWLCVRLWGHIKLRHEMYIPLLGGLMNMKGEMDWHKCPFKNDHERVKCNNKIVSDSSSSPNLKIHQKL